MKNTKRILAWTGILAVVLVFAALTFLTLTGGSERMIMALLFCLIVIPVLIYGFLLAAKTFRHHDPDE